MSKPFIPSNLKLSDLLNYRLKISTVDNKNYIGILLSFDDKLNLVLSETEETRINKRTYAEMRKNNSNNNNTGSSTNNIKPVYEKRTLGLIILRGDQIVNLTIESTPLTSVKDRIEKGANKFGKDRPLAKPRGKIKKLA
ncbi:unnamed protein product [Candida verbasci]|uniref:Sm protein B n=1 Tax=Candida verbasci TaxID=1227364 RepID=A0A9W4TS10_9ASCO|nr:unnamed protein product [Candida verbasci]